MNAKPEPALPTKEVCLEALKAVAERQAADMSKKGLKGKKRGLKTRNGGTWSDAKFWGVIRSALRRTFRYWKPAVQALNEAKIAWPGPRGRKWGYICAVCGGTFQRDDVQIDHKEPCGTLKSYEDIAPFLKRLTPEDPKAYAVLCTDCHFVKTQAERAAKE